MHAALFALVVSVLLPASAVADPAPSTLLASLKAYEAAANRHDWTAVVPLMAEDAVIDLGGDLAIVGRDNARALHEWERAMGTETHYTDCRVEGQTVRCRATEENDFQRATGLAPIEYTSSVVVFENGRVVRMSATLSEESAAEVSRVMQPFLAWAGKAQPTTVATFLKDDGSFVFGYDSAMAFKRLLRLYEATRAGGSRNL
jgi:hypothetical protein